MQTEPTLQAGLAFAVLFLLFYFVVMLWAAAVVVRDYIHRKD